MGGWMDGSKFPCSTKKKKVNSAEGCHQLTFININVSKGTNKSDILSAGEGNIKKYW